MTEGTAGQETQTVQWEKGKRSGGGRYKCPLAMEKRQRVSVPLLEAKVAQSPRNRLKIVILAEHTRLLRLIRMTSSL